MHALAGNKRGDQLALCLTRLQALAPDCRRVGLSATVAWPEALCRWVAPDAKADSVHLIEGGGAVDSEVRMLVTREEMPWSGHMAVHALPEVYEEIRKAGTTLVFVNTRAQAEIVFQELWRVNDDNLPIALHHGSLAREQRQKAHAQVEELQRQAHQEVDGQRNQ